MSRIPAAELDAVGGGLEWSTPAIVALRSTSVLSPLALSFSAGYAVGTFIYRNWIE